MSNIKTKIKEIINSNDSTKNKLYSLLHLSFTAAKSQIEEIKNAIMEILPDLKDNLDSISDFIRDSLNTIGIQNELMQINPNNKKSCERNIDEAIATLVEKIMAPGKKKETKTEASRSYIDLPKSSRYIDLTKENHRQPDSSQGEEYPDFESIEIEEDNIPEEDPVLEEQSFSGVDRILGHDRVGSPIARKPDYLTNKFLSQEFVEKVNATISAQQNTVEEIKAKIESLTKMRGEAEKLLRLMIESKNDFFQQLAGYQEEISAVKTEADKRIGKIQKQIAAKTQSFYTLFKGTSKISSAGLLDEEQRLDDDKLSQRKSK